MLLVLILASGERNYVDLSSNGLPVSLLMQQRSRVNDVEYDIEKVLFSGTSVITLLFQPYSKFLEKVECSPPFNCEN